MKEFYIHVILFYSHKYDYLKEDKKKITKIKCNFNVRYNVIY